MKIHNNSIGSYVGFTENVKKVKTEEQQSAVRKYDVIDIKNRVVTNDEVKLSDVKKEIKEELSGSASAEKIASLKKSIKENTYKIDVEEIVRRILR